MPGKCYANAVAESFWATIKTECFRNQIPDNRDQARVMVSDHPETFENPVRRQSAPGSQSPVTFENKHCNNQHFCVRIIGSPLDTWVQRIPFVCHYSNFGFQTSFPLSVPFTDSFVFPMQAVDHQSTPNGVNFSNRMQLRYVPCVYPAARHV